MFTASCVQLRLELLVCDRSVSVSIITNKFVGLKCMAETKIQILYDHVNHTRFHIVEMGCQMVQLLSAYIVGLTVFVNLTAASVVKNMNEHLFKLRQCFAKISAQELFLNTGYSISSFINAAFGKNIAGNKRRIPKC